MTTDSHFIDAALGGDASAFGQLVTKYQNRLFNTLFRITGCREEAEDVVQESFVQAFIKLDSFKRESAFYTWLYRIAFNISVSRRRKRRPVASTDQAQMANGIEPVDESQSPTDELEQQEQVASVHQALATLSEEHRRILVLRELEDCNYETISEILELPVGTVRSRLFRARQQLKEVLRRKSAESNTT